MAFFRFFAPAVFCALAVPVSAAAPLAAVDGLERGLWELTTPGEPVRRLCVTDPNALFQIQHANMPCSRLVIANQPTVATIHYSCPGAGWGRTTLRVSTPRTARIDSQGIADNAPFAFVAEAHRTGDCSPKSARLDR